MNSVVFGRLVRFLEPYEILSFLRMCLSIYFIKRVEKMHKGCSDVKNTRTPKTGVKRSYTITCKIARPVVRPKAAASISFSFLS